MKTNADGGVPSGKAEHEEKPTESRGEEATPDLKKGSPPELPDRAIAADTRTRHRFSEIAKRPTVQGATVGTLALAAAVVLIVRIESPPAPGWHNIFLDFLVPLAAASFLYMLQQGARTRQEEFDKAMLKIRHEHERKLEARKEQLSRDLQEEEKKLEKELRDREEALERELNRASREFLLKFQKVQEDRQVSVARQRHRLAARLSIADHIGDINGHVSAIDSILTAMSPTEQPATTSSGRDSIPEMPSSEAELGVITGCIRIPARLRRLLEMQDIQE